MDYKERLITTDLLPLSYWHEVLDIIFLFKAINGLIHIDSDVLPVMRDTGRTTRSNKDKAVTLTQKKCKTATYQRSFFVRVCRTWNTLPANLRDKNVSLSSYKKSLIQYYHRALESVYDQDDPRTWKSICVRCNNARGLHTTPSCCF